MNKKKPIHPHPKLSVLGYGLLGTKVKLKRIINDFEFCQLPTKSFKIKKEKDGE